MVFLEACAAEEGNARPNEMQLPEAVDELTGDIERTPELLPARAWAAEETEVDVLRVGSDDGHGAKLSNHVQGDHCDRVWNDQQGYFVMGFRMIGTRRYNVVKFC